MQDHIKEEIVRLAKAEFNFSEKGRRDRVWLQQGKCPSCGKNELFLNQKEPWRLSCGRKNNCGYTESTKDRYPDAFGKWNLRFPPTTEAPDATAKAYMASCRGIDPKVSKGSFTQGAFRHKYGNQPTATVVFEFPTGEGKTAKMERFVETVIVSEPGREADKRKQNFIGPHAGYAWTPASMEIEDGDEVWLVEACIDALSLWNNNIKSAAILSASNYPEHFLEQLKDRDIKLVWALDNDRAGNESTKKFAKLAREEGFLCTAATPRQGRDKKVDWNDLHLEWLTTDQPAREEIIKTAIDECRYLGALVLAENQKEKALIMWERKKQTEFYVEYGYRTYWFEIQQDAYAAYLKQLRDSAADNGEEIQPAEIEREAAEKAAKIWCICPATIEFMYFQKDPLTDESRYFARIRRPKNKQNGSGTFVGAQISSSSDFKKRLMDLSSGALWTGTTNHLNQLLMQQMEDIRSVETVEFMGYSKEHETWLFADTAIKGGKRYKINRDDFFEIGDLSLKSLNRSLGITIGQPKDYRSDWATKLYDAYGARGLVVATFFFGSLFAEQIRAKQESFPFLEVVGDPGSGKSTLIEFLWRLMGRRSYEGFDPNKSTSAARSRIMSQVAGLPISFIESEREELKIKTFDWDEIKTAYNGRPSRATGVKNGGNDTKEPLFRGTILITQNDSVHASQAIRERIIHLKFSLSFHTEKGQQAADQMTQMSVEKLSNFVAIATQAEKQVLTDYDTYYQKYLSELATIDEIRLMRIKKNHAQLMALAHAMAKLIDLPDHLLKETLDQLTEAARERQTVCGVDCETVASFWQSVEFIGLHNLNHSIKPDTVAISLPHIIQEFAKASQPLPDQAELKRKLVSSKAYQFVEKNKATHSGLPNFKTVKCWVFRAPKGGI